MQITEEKLNQIENDLIRFFRHVALPRFMKEVRDSNEKGGYEAIDESHDFIDEFLQWIEITGFDTQNITPTKNGNGN